MPRFERLADWLAWQQRAHPFAIELGLDRVARVLERTGWRRPARPVITVGGTNGKGSCVAMLDAILRAAGCRVGTFTSPHLVDYRERVRLDGRRVSEASLIAAFERIADALADDSLTFFEFNTLAALLVFETWAPDVVVLEVGMGGRLDAVNVVDADASIVASVGLDHMEWLGPDVESIGREKAGIFRADRPAIYGGDAPPRSLVAHAEEVGARLLLRGRDFDGVEQPDRTWTYGGPGGERRGLPMPALPGVAQVGNAATVLAALDALGGRVRIDRGAIQRGLERVALPARFQRIADARGFEWVVDVAHNPDAAAVLAANLERFPVAGRTLAVCGMLADKDVAAVLGVLEPRVDQWFAAATDGPRALADAELTTIGSRLGLSLRPAGTVPEALSRAAIEARAGDRIVVFGSFHTAGPALEWLGHPPQ